MIRCLPLGSVWIRVWLCLRTCACNNPIVDRRHKAPWTITRLMELSTGQYVHMWDILYWQMCAHMLMYVFKCVGLYLNKGMHEVTIAYFKHKIPHRSSWSQVFIIAPDRAVHPQPRTKQLERKFGKSLQRISRTVLLKHRRCFCFTCDILYTWRHRKMNRWSRCIAR